ncbi:TRM11 family SAM-dependent methyltransferase [Paenibacillus sacheonensis]|uniref:Methyltransferase domain-containing protein n=1 Tax=Paenibacillus sacheonensis TaxID=742054 RepID=A0A7X4YU72_9BACL|nr:methyltransferase domain-containing protein [Paenibacillus sacheonensis]MBM7568991.1 tRNA G10 N-methylase Trm11 [Paenibacillus sacheonensis]NBC72638.1 methyltransferase domain-containing protein [Paenibacillus sacheonensis]
MKMIENERYLYPAASHEDEQQLFGMEMRALFGLEADSGCVIIGKNVDPSRSPFLRGRLKVLLTGDTPADIAGQAGNAVRLDGATFKITFVCGDLDYERQLAVEKEIGWAIQGKAEMRRPDRLFGAAYVRGRYWFGEYTASEPLWLKHNAKPQPYSTALGTRLARAATNIAVPVIDEGMRVIDPCCGIGTVLIEAMSMGIDIVGYDLNPLALKGARVNLAHFGMPDVVRRADMTTLEPGEEGPYDAAILDLPYNLCSVLPDEERLAMLRSARRLARRIVIVTTETIDEAIAEAGLRIADRCVVRKGKFERHILCCEGL